MLAIPINGEVPSTIERVMMNHILFTMAVADDADHFPIVIHYAKE